MDQRTLDQSFMQQAEALKASGLSEDAPSRTALLVKGNEVVSTGMNRRISTGDPIRFAEMDCIAEAGRRSDHATLILYSTDTPNWLVAGTIVQFGIGTLVFGGDEQSKQVQFLRDKGVNLRHWGISQ